MIRRSSLMALLSATLPAMVSCATLPHRSDARVSFGKVYFLDAAGGGSILTNWGHGVVVGLQAGGYAGGFESFHWQTGFGVVADQQASLSYKRSKAHDLAREISQFIATHPSVPVHLLGLSAGTAIAIFALEELSETNKVESVVFLGSSLSSHYDLTKSLQRVRGRVYVFTSQHDAILSIGVAIFGTADREYCGACSVGLHGFHLPLDASSETRELYGKIENIAWRSEFARTGNLGGHTDTVKSEFVAAYIAPLLTGDGPRFLYAATDATPDFPPSRRDMTKQNE